MEHEGKMPEEAMTYKLKLDRAKFETHLFTKLQQQSNQLEMNLMQETRHFRLNC